MSTVSQSWRYAYIAVDSIIEANLKKALQSRALAILAKSADAW